VQVPPVAFVTVTVPVGTGFPELGALALTEKFAVIVWPLTTFVWGELTLVEVAACVTCRLTVPELPA
jgi:hypothetical protein